MTDPATLTRAEAVLLVDKAIYDGRFDMENDGTNIANLIAVLWPNGIRIVPDPIPEPGPEVDNIKLTKLNGQRRLFTDGGSGWFWPDRQVVYSWLEVVRLVADGWTLTEYVAKDGAK